MIIILICIVLVLMICFFVNKYRNMPPGPYGLPIIGVYPFFGEKQMGRISELSEKYDDIMTVTIMGKTYWILNSFEAIEEAFVTKGDIFAGRPSEHFHFVGTLIYKNTMMSTEGDEWKVINKFVLGQLSKLGMGKSEFEVRMHNMFDSVEQYIEETNGKPHDFQIILSNFAFNAICTLIASKHYDRESEFFLDVRKSIRQIFTGLRGLNYIVFGDLFRYWLKFRGNKEIDMVKNTFNHLADLAQQIINERLAAYDANNCQNLIDYWIKESSGPNGEYFQLKYLSRMFGAMLIAGMDSSASMFYHCLHLMALHPNIQQKVFDEIDSTIGNEAMFFYSDRERLPYTQAVLYETQRFVSLGAIGSPHVNRVETTLRGYHVPKRTIVYANLLGVSRSKRYFKNPHEFDPNNFLDENGCFKHNKASMPFGTGIRKCTGMKLSEVEIYLGFIRLMRKFEWTLPNNETGSIPKTLEEALRFMQPFQVCAKLRQ